MLRQAILDDEVQVKTQDGVAFCQWRELKEEHMDERATDAKLALDPKKVSGQQAAQITTLFDSVSMERPDPSAEDLAAASASCPSTFSSPHQGAPTLPAVEDKKEDDAVALERLSAKEWEQADGLLKKAEAAVEKLKKAREREREAVARDPFFFFCFCVMHQHYEGCDEADREDQTQQRRPPDHEAAPWLLFPIVRTHETTDAVPSCIY